VQPADRADHLGGVRHVERLAHRGAILGVEGQRREVEAIGYAA
jgi:hypothetical protein